MTVFDPNIALASVLRNLIPGKELIDGRTQKDDIVFIAQLSGLINFYEENNTKKDTWLPFVLKDPVFLLAIISRYPYSKHHETYLNERNTLDQLLDGDTWTEEMQHITERHLAITLALLLSIFETLAAWVVFMLMPDHHYDLRNYTIRQIEDQFGTTVWSLIALVNAASEVMKLTDLPAVPTRFASEFPSYPWLQKPGAIIDIDLHPDRLTMLLKAEKGNWQSNPENYRRLYRPLCKIGDPLFAFLKKVTDHADIEYRSEIAKKTPFPDTLLLRTFTDALTVQRTALNRIPGKHLDFYYRDILKQKPLPGIADSVYLTLTTGAKVPVSVPKGTLFNGGTENNHPILFSANNYTAVNPAVINNAYTLCKVKERPATITETLQANDTESLSLSVNTVGKIVTNTDGSISGWRCFGDSGITGADVNRLTFSIVFATPILLLREGTRKVTITLTPANDKYFTPPSAIYLSTATSWLQVTNTDTASPLKIEFTLTPDQEGIVPYPKNPEGINSEWPLLKLEFNKTVSWAEPPILTQLDIQVDVKNLHSSVFYNDYGPAGGKLPFQLFGPTPMPGAAFTFGNNEVFSKPVNYLSFDISWNNLPATGFHQYYSSYNNYLAKSGDNPNVPYSDLSFLASFATLNNGNWTPPHTKPAPTSPVLLFVPVANVVPTQYKKNTAYTFEAPPDAYIFQPCPGLQTGPYTLSSVSKNGFMKIKLHGTPWGFGSTLYPKVISFVTLNRVKELLPHNGDSQQKNNEKKQDLPNRIATGVVKIMKVFKHFLVGDDKQQTQDDKEDVMMPNVPFAPAISQFEITNYKAGATYTFGNRKADATPVDYPIECYQVSMLGNNLVYSNTSCDPHPGILPGNSSGADKGLSLFPAIGFEGYLLISLDHMAAPADLSLYFELSGTASAIPPKETLSYFYKTKDSWQELNVISDSTLGLTRSGIITISIPTDAFATKWMAADTPKHWIAIIAKTDISYYGKVSFLSTNGIFATRLANELQYENSAPMVRAGSINKMQIGIPGITSVIQPFPSFGGMQPETSSSMNQRVSQRILTKDRAATAADYFRLTKQRFGNVYYVGTGYRSGTKINHIWVIKQFSGPDVPGAYKPAFENTELNAILDWIKPRTSAFTNLMVDNFTLVPVTVSAQITVLPGYSFDSVVTEVEAAINLFLSPWITTKQLQLTPGKNLTAASIATLIKNVPGIRDVQDISFNKSSADTANGLILASSLDHTITPITTR
jgi:hypothetical protein